MDEKSIMSRIIDGQRLTAALEKARDDLLAERSSDGNWVGRVSSSPMATATAISALVIAEQYGSPEQHGRRADRLFDADQIFQSDLSELIVQSLHWLACHQNGDGGWGDTDISRSDLSTTLLVNAAFHLTGVPAKYSGLLERAESFIREQGGVTALRKRYEAEKPLAAAILANCALAGLVSWKDVPPLPFELAAAPRPLSQALQLAGIHYSLPELVAVGQTRFHHAPPVNPIDRALRRISRQPTIEALEQMQPESGGFLESVQLTSFVVMSLASVGLAEHRIVRRGVQFVLANVRGDGSWPLHVNLSVRNTALALGALQALKDGRLYRGGSYDRSRLGDGVEWLLRCQRTARDPYSRAEPGGWAWTDLSGGVPNAEDTSGVLLTLARTADRIDLTLRRRVATAARRGTGWLLTLQNKDGGWSTFSRGLGHPLLHRSSSDVTAQALRAMAAVRRSFVDVEPVAPPRGLAGRLDNAIQRGLAYLQSQQREAGHWVPLWFGNENNAGDENPVFGTSRVLIALADLGYQGSEMARRGGDWLCQTQHAGGGWGPTAIPSKPSEGTRGGVSRGNVPSDAAGGPGPSVEETSLAVTALARLQGRSPAQQAALEQGLAWVTEAIENGRHREPAPIGFHFGRFWYYERLYPILFAVDALVTAATAWSSIEGTAPLHATPA